MFKIITIYQLLKQLDIYNHKELFDTLEQNSCKYKTEIKDDRRHGNYEINN
jgi:hypothetical protein